LEKKAKNLGGLILFGGWPYFFLKNFWGKTPKLAKKKTPKKGPLFFIPSPLKKGFLVVF